MSKLNIPFVRDIWVPALKSGEYQQATKVLKDDEGGFCCLGVACDLLKGQFSADWDGQNFLGESTVLPVPVEVFLGLTDVGAYVSGTEMDEEGYEDEVYFKFRFDDFVTPELSDANDQGAPFSDIADELLRLCDYVEAQEAGAPA